MMAARNIFRHFTSFSDTNNDTGDSDNNHNQISCWGLLRDSRKICQKLYRCEKVSLKVYVTRFHVGVLDFSLRRNPHGTGSLWILHCHTVTIPLSPSWNKIATPPDRQINIKGRKIMFTFAYFLNDDGDDGFDKRQMGARHKCELDRLGYSWACSLSAGRPTQSSRYKF